MMHTKKILFQVGMFLAATIGIYSFETAKKNIPHSYVIPEISAFATVDFIYWSATQADLSYAQNGLVGIGDPPYASTLKGKKHNLDNKWAPGFKIGFGIDSADCAWDLYVNYTNFKNHVKTKTEDPTATMTGTWQIPGAIGSLDVPLSISVLTQASSDWMLHFNNLDVEVGRKIWCTCCFLIRPYVGLKGSWQRQRNNVVYFRPLTNALDGSEAHIRHVQDYWGIGLRAGLNTAWQINNTWSLFADFALSGLYSKFQNKRKDDLSITTDTDVFSFTPIDMRNHTSQIQPVLELLLGLQWQTNIFSKNCPFTIQGTVEGQVWFDHNHYITFSDYHDGNLTLQGVSIQLSQEF